MRVKCKNLTFVYNYRHSYYIQFPSTGVMLVSATHVCHVYKPTTWYCG